jgi:hypothetical protein
MQNRVAERQHSPHVLQILMVTKRTLRLERHNLFLAFVMRLNFNKISYKQVQLCHETEFQ